MDSPVTITLIGSGNVATRLAFGWMAAGVNIRQIISKTKNNAEALGAKISVKNTGNDLQEIDDLSDFYVIAVKDDDIEDILTNLPFCFTGNQTLLHTSGTFDETNLQKVAKNYGCLYPLQTFSKTREVDLKNTPFFIHACDENTLTAVRALAGVLSDHIYFTNHQQRQKYHLAAVFANNFTNHLFTISKDYCQKNHIDFDLLWPLIEEGTMKAKMNGPERSQTGPAVRLDQKTIQNHIRLLDKDPDWLNLYQILTELIQQRHKSS